MCLIRIGEGYFLAALYIVGQRIDVYDILGCGSEPFDYGIKPQLGFYFFSFALRNIFIGKPLQVRTSSYCKSGSISPSSLLIYITTQVWVSRLMLIILSNDSLTEW